MPRVSVIIPVFNLENYIAECLDSLLEQTFHDYEIIIVDDGSTDQSGMICRKYAENFNFVRYCRQQNSGVSAARNRGLDLAKGEFIVFVDGDDIVSDFYLEHMVRLVSNDVDLGVIGYTSALEEMNGCHAMNCTLIEAQQLEKSVLMDIKIGGYLWNKIFKRDIIKTYKVRFDENILVWEDLLFVLTYMKATERCGVSTCVDYYYRLRENSAVAAMTIRKLESKIVAAQRLMDLEKESEYEIRSFVKNMYVNALFDYTSFFCKQRSVARIQKIDKIRYLVSNRDDLSFNKDRLIKILKMIVWIII